MRFRYDPKSGALYFRLREGAIEETLELPSPGAYLDVDEAGHVMGLEFLSLQEFVTFITGFDGEVEIPEAIDPEEFEESIRIAEQLPPGDSEELPSLISYWRKLLQVRSDRDRARRGELH
jgi:uncharacterized protein YuzE